MPGCTARELFMVPVSKLAVVASVVLALGFASEAKAVAPQAAGSAGQVTVVGAAAQTSGKGLHKGKKHGKKHAHKKSARKGNGK